MKIEFVGLKKVVDNINKEIGKIEGRCLEGLISAGLFIRGESQKLTPVATGNLRNSAYVVSELETHAGHTKVRLADPATHMAKVGASQAECKAATIPTVIVGYTASYAIFVHENPRAGKTGGVSPSGILYKPNKGSKRIVFSSVGQWKFLEQAIMDNQRKILAIIKAKAKK